MKKHFCIIFVTALLLVFVMMLSTCIAEDDYNGEATGSINGVNIYARNWIRHDRYRSNACTLANNQSASTYVSATFYWINYSDDTMGSYTRYNGGNGQAYVYGDNYGGLKYYYKVISSHTASYDGGTFSYPNLTTYAP